MRETRLIEERIIMPAWLAAVGSAALTTFAYVVITAFRRRINNIELTMATLSLVVLAHVIAAMTLPIWFPAQS